MASGWAWRTVVGGLWMLGLLSSCSLLNEALLSCDPLDGTGCSDSTLACQITASSPQATGCVSLSSPPRGAGESCKSNTDCYGGYACDGGRCTQLCRIGSATTCTSQPAVCVAPSGSQIVYGFCASAMSQAATDQGVPSDMAVAVTPKVTCDPVANVCADGNCKVVSVSPPGTTCLSNNSTEGFHDGDPCTDSSVCNGALSCIQGHCRGLCQLPSSSGGTPDQRCGFLYNPSDVCVEFDALPWGVCCPPGGC